MYMQWLVHMLPNLPSLIPKMSTSLINPDNIEPLLLVLNDIHDPVDLILEKIGLNQCTQELILRCGFADSIATIPLTETLLSNLNFELLFDFDASIT